MKAFVLWQTLIGSVHTKYEISPKLSEAFRLVDTHIIDDLLYCMVMAIFGREI